MPDIILTNLSGATTPLTGTERVPMDQRVGAAISAAALTPGLGYVIVTLGSTAWAACGVPAGVTPVVGLAFTCTAAGTGTGTAQQVETVDAAASDVAALAAGAIASAVASHEAAGNPHPGYTTESEVNTIIAGLTHLDVSITGALTQDVRNDSGASMAAGTPYHVVGAVGDTSRVRVVPARADTPSTMPANGILQQALTATGGSADGHGVVGGSVTGLATAGGSEGATVWVGLTGGLGLTRPATNPQPIGTLSRIHATTGSMVVAIGPVLSTVAFTGAYSDLTMATARILARFTAGTGAVEQVGLSPGFVHVDGSLYHEQWLGYSLGGNTDASAATNVAGSSIPYKAQLLAVKLDLSEAPAGANFVVDINKGVNGSSVLSTKLSIDAGETDSTTAAVPAVISDSNIPANTYLSFDIDQVGATAGSRGKRPVVWLLLRRVL